MKILSRSLRSISLAQGLLRRVEVVDTTLDQQILAYTEVVHNILDKYQSMTSDCASNMIAASTWIVYV
jgi:hypothetical protein